jgi:subtilase family serine protease
MRDSNSVAASKIKIFAVISALSLGTAVGCVDPMSPTEGTETADISVQSQSATHSAIDPETGDLLEWSPLCTHGAFRCAAVGVARNGVTRHDAANNGYGPSDMQDMYGVDATKGAGITIALVDAYGYPSLEADLATYRSTYGLPACTTATGCLKIVNGNGTATPPTTSDAGWDEETALDIQMVSAICPLCHIVVVEADVDADPKGLIEAQSAAATQGVTSISNSWSTPEYSGVEEDDSQYFTHPGVAIYAATGDWGYEELTDTQDGSNDHGPQWPSTSPQVIAVGGTTVSAATGTTRGWKETAWTSGGSSCSLAFPKPSYQPADSGCAGRAASDVAALADPNTGIAIYTAGAWAEVGGTSAATPIVASLMAAAGHGDATPELFYDHATIFNDVTSGNNGTCATKVCDSGAGWDGPTGNGSPNQMAIAALTTPSGGTGGSNSGGGTGPTGNGGGTDPTSPTGTDGGNQDIVGGCAAGGTGSSGALFLVAMALGACIVRRRAA